MADKEKELNKEADVKEQTSGAKAETTDAKEADVNTENKEAGTENVEADTESKEEKKDKKDLKIEELNDKYIRLMAEFDNYRKRTDKEKAAMYEIGAKDVIEKILPVIDNFERAFKTLTEEEKASSLADGMDRVYKQLMKAFDEVGVKEIDALNKEFDPNLHNAVMHVEDENFGENTICEEFQKGYTYRDNVVRHSMVKVAN